MGPRLRALRSLCDGHHKKALFIVALRKKNRAFLTAPLRWNKQRPDAVSLAESVLSKENNNASQGRHDSGRPTRVGTASAALADANNPADYLSSFDQRPLSMMPNGHTRAVNDAAEPFTAERNASFRCITGRPCTECPVPSWHNGQNDPLDQIDRTQRQPDSYQSGTHNFR